MAGLCPAPAAGDPLVQGLLATTDCNVQVLVRSGYGALFEGGAGFASVLTVLLTLYVALLGYRLMLGRAQLNISDLALTAVKLGVVIALATQWGTYQTLVYRFLFEGPQQAADALLAGLGSNGVGYRGDVFAGLQHAFDDLTAFSPATPPGAPPPSPPAAAAALPAAGALSRPGFDSLLMMSSAVVLLLSSLGVLLAAKIVLGLLLALGPVFIALLLFDSTRGLFEGWLRASLAFAFAPLATTLMLGLALILLAPSLAQIEAMRETGAYVPGVGFQVLILALVFAGVSGGLVVAAGMIAGGLRRAPSARPVAVSPTSAGGVAPPEPATPSRAARIAAAAVSQERRDAVWTEAAGGFGGGERRLSSVGAPLRARPEGVPAEARLGQAAPRRAMPRAARARSDRRGGA